MTDPKRTYTLAIIPGDGIGKEVVPEGLRVLEAVAKLYDFELKLEHHDFGSCDYYLKHGQMMPDDWQDRVGSCDAIFFGAVGWPDTVPDHVSVWGSILKFRKTFDQYVNLRPARLMPGVPCPLVGRSTGDIDFVIVRENTEGEYSSVGGMMFEGTDREIVIQETIMSRHGIDRILRYAFEVARSRPRKQGQHGRHIGQPADEPDRRAQRRRAGCYRRFRDARADRRATGGPRSRRRDRLGRHPQPHRYAQPQDRRLGR